MMVRLVWWSSTTMTRTPWSAVASGGDGPSMSAVRSRPSVNQKVPPCPGPPVTPASPPMCSTSSVHSAKPSAPVPVTSKRTVARLPMSVAIRARSVTSPASVHRTALSSSGMSTWRMRPGSARTISEAAGSTTTTRSRPFSVACGATRRPASSMSRRRSKSMTSISVLAEAIVEASMMPLITVSSAAAETLIASAYSRCSASSAVSRSSPVMPITPFIGVRISWLMVTSPERSRIASSSVVTGRGSLSASPAPFTPGSTVARVILRPRRASVRGGAPPR